MTTPSVQLRRRLYFLPGTMCDKRLWRSMTQYLEKLAPNSYDYHYLTIGEQPSVDDIVDDIKCQLPNEKVLLVGFSLGGYLANSVAVKYPQLIEKLLIISNMPNVLPLQEVKERSRTVNWIKKNGYSGIAKKRVLALLGQQAQRNESIIQLIIDMDNDLGAKVLTHQLLVTTQRENLETSLLELPVEKYFCVGDEDRLVAVDCLTTMSNDDPRLNLTVFKNTGHMLPLEQPELLAQWIYDAVN